MNTGEGNMTFGKEKMECVSGNTSFQKPDAH